MIQDFEIGENVGLLNEQTKSVPESSRNNYRLFKSIGASAGILTIGIFLCSVYQKVLYPSSSTLFSSTVTSSFKACVDDSHIGSSLEVEAEEGCAYLFSSSSSKVTDTGKSNMVKLCSCRSGTPALLSHTALESYGVITAGSSRLNTIVTGPGAYVTLYEGSSFEGNSLEVGSSIQKRLSRYEDTSGKSWDNRVMSISFRSSKGVCDKMEKCIYEGKSLQMSSLETAAQSMPFKDLVAESKLNFQSTTVYTELKGDPGFLSCPYNWIVPYGAMSPADSSVPVDKIFIFSVFYLNLYYLIFVD